MKFYLFTFLFFIQLFVFGQNNPQEDSLKREREHREMYENRRKKHHENCTRDSLKAVTDSKIQNKYYINLVAPNGDNFLPAEELKQILNKHHIIWGGEWMGSDFGGYAPYSCYYVYMTRLTEEKFGKEFMDGLVKESLLKYIDKNPSVIFKYNDHFDLLYDNDDLSDDKIINEYFFKDFTYPKGYEVSKEKNQYFTEVKLHFNKDTHKLSVINFKHHIDNNHNKQFIPYFEKKIRNFVKSRNFVNIDHTIYEVKTYFKIYYK